MNAQFKKGILEMCILHLISQRDMYGFEVIEALGQHIDVNENTVYPILRRLTLQGHFTTYNQSTSLGAPRKYYQLTDKGNKQLLEFNSEWTNFLEGVFALMKGDTQ